MFDNADVTLKAENILITEGGLFQVQRLQLFAYYKRLFVKS